MKLTGRIPVEPLDEERLTRIERNVVAGAVDMAARPARAARFSPALAFAAAAVVAIGAGVAGWKLRGGAPAPELAAAPNDVRTDGQRTTLDIGDARIHGEPATAFTITRPAGGVLVAMARGKVSLEVAKRGDRPPLVVKAGDTEVVVVGTQFTVDYGDGTGEVDVRVAEGAVRVVRLQQETRVAAGQAWTSRRGLVALADATPGPRAAGGAARPEAAAPGATIDEPAHRGNGEGIEIDVGKAPDVLRERVAAVPDVRAPQPGTGPAASRTPTGGAAASSAAADRPDAAAGAHLPRGDLKALIRAQPVLPALEVGASDPLQQMAEYRAIMTREKGPKEAYAFYSMAVIQSSKLGRTADALATLTAFRRRAPSSEHFAAALWLEVRIRCLQSLDEACRQAATFYTQHAPEGPALHVAERIALTR